MTALRLIRIELLKLHNRRSFRVTVLAYLVTVTASFLFAAYAIPNAGGERPALPAAWREIHGILSQICVFLVVITILDLTASEYQWRTSRQNIIDGLSREQYFLAKVLNVPLATSFFMLTGYTIAVTIVAITGGVKGAFISGVYGKAIGGLAITTLGFSSMALLSSFLTRSVGGAIALVFGYWIIGENLIQLALWRIGEPFVRANAYLPVAVFGRLMEPGQYDPRLRGGGGPPWASGPVETEWLLLAALLYFALFVGASFLLVKRRDV